MKVVNKKLLTVGMLIGLFAVVLSSCHRETCPTYTKQDVSVKTAKSV